jgi:hypothetical protein
VSINKFDIGSHTVHPALARCPEPRLFGGRDSGLWEWPDSSCHSLVGSFKIEFFFFVQGIVPIEFVICIIMFAMLKTCVKKLSPVQIQVFSYRYLGNGIAMDTRVLF